MRSGCVSVADPPPWLSPYHSPFEAFLLTSWPRAPRAAAPYPPSKKILPELQQQRNRTEQERRCVAQASLASSSASQAARLSPFKPINLPSHPPPRPTPPPSRLQPASQPNLNPCRRLPRPVIGGRRSPVHSLRVHRDLRSPKYFTNTSSSKTCVGALRYTYFGHKCIGALLYKTGPTSLQTKRWLPNRITASPHQQQSRRARAPTPAP